MATSRAEIDQDEVLTGEAVALDVQPAGYLLRLLGAVIDMLITIILAVAFIVLLGWATGWDATLLPPLGIATAVLLLVVVPTAAETVTGGRSLGKLVVGARIVRADGGSAGFRHALIRALTGVLEIWFTLGAVAAVVGVFTPRAQRLGDLLAGTYAERARAPQVPPPASGVPPQLAGWAAIADVASLPAPVARRAAQFVRSADALDPGIRHRVAGQLADEIAAHVSPVPTVDPETFVRAAVAVRRDREFRALAARDARARALTG